MIRIIKETPGFTLGAVYAMMGACWDDHGVVQYDWHAVNNDGILSIIPIDSAEYA